MDAPARMLHAACWMPQARAHLQAHQMPGHLSDPFESQPRTKYCNYVNSPAPSMHTGKDGGEAVPIFCIVHIYIANLKYTR